MTQPSLESFFSAGGGGKSVSWKNQPIGTTVSGVIKAVHPPQQVTDPVDGKPKFNKRGEPVMQVRIDLNTELRNWELCKRPEDPNEVDDGSRSVYAGVWMAAAIGDATRKAGHRGPPEVGATLSVTLSERAPNRDNPALNPTNKFTAVYTPASAAATQQFFGGSDPATPPAPVRPAAISEAAWNAMDDATKRNVAATMGTLDSDKAPPF